MKIHIQHLILVALLLLVIQLYFSQSTRQLTHEINIQLDSLRQVLHRYERLQLRYDTAYHRLVHTRKELLQLEALYNNQHTAQQSELQHILNQLQELSDDKGVLPPPEILSVDSLRFSP